MSMRTLFLGHFGSGKTEVAIAYALSSAAAGQRPLLLDLDFITPYFRSRDVALDLADRGVDVVAPDGELARSDLPVVTARAVQALTHHPGDVCADVGGDEGARVVGSLAGRLAAGPYQAYMVVNPYRPGTGTVDEVIAYARWLQGVARVSFTGLINNANAGDRTRPVHVRDGLRVVHAAADAMGLPVVTSTATAAIAAQLPDLEVMPLHLRMRPPWELPVAGLPGR